MATTKQITISCDEVKVTPCGNHLVYVEMEDFSVDDLLDTIDQDDIVAYIERKLNPEDVFSSTQLEKWAESEGYVKQNENQ